MVIEGLIQWFKELYKNDKDLMLIIISLIGGWILSVVLPAIYSQVSKFISIIGKKFGGRLAYRSIREAYLNWLVYKTQDLNLTGIIGTGEKPKLEQIFISLRIVKEQEKFSKKIEGKEEIKKPFWKRFLSQFSEFYLRVRNVGLYQPEHGMVSKENIIFKPQPSWKVYQIFYREGINDVIGVIGFIILFGIVPYYLLLLSSNIYTVQAFFGSYSWSLLIIFGLLLSYMGVEEKEIFTFFMGVFLWVTPTILIFYTIQEKVFYGSQSPLAIELGAMFGITSFIIIYLYGRIILDLDKKPFAKEIGEIISSNNYIAILGKPGSGKSTLSQFLALTLAQEKAGDYKLKRKGILKKRFGTNEWFLPIFIPLREISKFLVEADSEKYENLIIEAFRQKILPSDIRNIFNNSYIYHMLENKKCLFLLDGLDEVQNSIEFKAVIKEINGLISRYPGNKVIVTSRHSGWRGGVGSFFNVFEIEDLNDEEISRFIYSWYNAIEENRARILANSESKTQRTLRIREISEKAHKLEQALSSTKSIRRIAENPLLLSIICFVHYNKTLPKERLRLYQDCSNLLLVQWDEEKGLAVDDTNLTFAHKEDIIQEIAFSLHTGKIGEAFGRKEASGDEIIPIVEKKLKEFNMDSTHAESLFQKLIERSGIIVITEKYSNRYSFSHLTFQEFYSAKYLYENKLDIFEVISKVSDNFTDALNGWWREVILLYCLLIKDPTEIIERLYQNAEKDFLQQNLQIAAQCIDESVKVPNQQVRDKIIEKLLRIRTIGTSSSNVASLNPKVKSYLIKFAQGPLFYRYVIADQITQVKAEDIAFLISKILQLLTSTDRRVRLIAIEALEILILNFNLSTAIKSSSLIESLNDTDPNIQKATAELILKSFLRPLDGTISFRILEIFEKSINSLIAERGHFQIISEKEGMKSKDICQILEDFIEVAPEETIIEIHQRICNIVFRIFQTNIQSKDYDVFVCIIKSLIRIDNRELKEAHKSQLLEALLKGNQNQQTLAIFALSELYGSDSSITRLILDKIEAPHSLVRMAAISSLNKLNSEDNEFKRVQTYLQEHRKPLSKLGNIHNFITQILTGKGKIGLQESELDTLESYFKNLDKNLPVATKEGSRFDEADERINKFLHKKEWSRIRSGERLFISEDLAEEDLFNLDEENLFRYLEESNIYRNEAAFNTLLERKAI